MSLDTNTRAPTPCAGKTHLFFPAPGERPPERARRELEARSLCLECPVRIPCRDYARKNGEFGVWGGENEEQRIETGHVIHRGHYPRQFTMLLAG